MIRPADGAVFDRIRSSDPFFTRILSLYKCYGGGYDFVGFWQQECENEVTALISRFEDKFSLWLTEGCDPEEISAFLSFQNAGSAMYDSESPLVIPDDVHTISGTVLEYIGEDHNSDLEIYTPDFKELYGLLKSCESDIFRVPEYLVLLSDLTHRRNMGRFTSAAVAVDGVLASSVMTVSETDSAVILGAVATHPDYRRRGLSRELVRALATDIRRHGRRVYVLSASDSNTRFYINSGFAPAAGFREIFLK